MKSILSALRDFGVIGLLLFALLITVNIAMGGKTEFTNVENQPAMDRNYKRTDFKLTAADYVQELSREATMRMAVYTKQVQEKKLSQREAARRFLMVTELKELMEMAQARGLRIEDLKQMLQDFEIKATPKQGKLFKGSQFPQ